MKEGKCVGWTLLSQFLPLPIVAGHIKAGFFRSTASSLWPTRNMLRDGDFGSGLKHDSGAMVAPFRALTRNCGSHEGLYWKPSGGFNEYPVDSRWPVKKVFKKWNGPSLSNEALPTRWIVLQSTILQKSFLSSAPNQWGCRKTLPSLTSNAHESF